MYDSSTLQGAGVWEAAPEVFMMVAYTLTPLPPFQHGFMTLHVGLF